MKRTFVLAALILLFVSSLNAQLLTESFDYPAGDSLTQHGWISFSGTVNGIFVTAPGLDFPGYQLPGIGFSARLRSTGQDVYKPLVSNQSSGNVYTFFIINVDTPRAVGATGDYFAGLLPSTSITNYTCRIYIRKSITKTDTFAFGISKNAISGGAVTWSDSIYSTQTNYLVGAKYTFNPGTTTDDEVSLFVFSSAPPLIEPLPTIGPVTGTTTDVADIGRFALRQGLATTAVTANIDEIWINSDWGTVLPVEISSFTSLVNGRSVTLNWSTSTETNNSGFAIERSSGDEWKYAGFVNGNGTASTLNNYSFTDNTLNTGSYSYRLKQIDFNGNYEYHNLSGEVVIGVPSIFSLSQNYPNPFNPSTKIDFDIPADASVSLSLYDMQGKLIRILTNEFKSAGYYSMTFNASDLPSGSYFYRLVASLSNPLSSGDFSATKRLMLVK